MRGGDFGRVWGGSGFSVLRSSVLFFLGAWFMFLCGDGVLVFRFAGRVWIGRRGVEYSGARKQQQPLSLFLSAMSLFSSHTHVPYPQTQSWDRTEANAMMD